MRQDAIQQNTTKIVLKLSKSTLCEAIHVCKDYSEHRSIQAFFEAAILEYCQELKTQAEDGH